MRDGVIGSLVPLASAADLSGVAVPQTKALMALVGGILDADVAASGRRLETMGLSGSADEVRRAVDALVRRTLGEAGVDHAEMLGFPPAL